MHNHLAQKLENQKQQQGFKHSGSSSPFSLGCQFRHERLYPILLNSLAEVSRFPEQMSPAQPFT
jgi:hypothetical protein